MATYKVLTNNELAGVGQGGTLTDSQLEGWDVPGLIKTGILELVKEPIVSTRTKKDKE